MSNSPRYIGFIDPPYNVTITDDSGAVMNLTGCTSNSFTLTMINPSTNTGKSGVGAWTVTNATAGQASYQYAAADMNTAGTWLLYTTVKLPSEPGPRELDPDTLVIYPGSVGAGAAPAGVLSTPPASPLIINVRDYGAYGDGTTDDTAAIQSAINAAATTSGAMYLPPGTYKLTASLTLPATLLSGFRMTGAGWGTILALANGVNDYAIKFLEAANGLNGAEFSHFKIDGNCTHQTGGGGIEANGATNCLFHNLWIHAPYNDGIHIHNGTLTGGFGVQSFVTNCLFDAGNTSAGNGRALSLDSTDQIMIIGNDFREMGGSSGADADCIRDNNGLSAVIGNIFTSNNSVSNVGGGGIKTYSNFSRIIGNQFESIPGGSIILLGNKHIVSGNQFLNIGKGAGSANQASGIYTSANNSIFADNYFNTDGSGTNGTQAFIFMDNGTTGNIVSGNQFDVSNGGSGYLVIKLGTSTTNQIRRNVGWTTENSGTASITSGNTSVTVTHGLSVTPTLQQIAITPQTSLGSAAFFWVSSPTSTQFTLNVNANPAQTVTFSWRADAGF